MTVSAPLHTLHSMRQMHFSPSLLQQFESLQPSTDSPALGRDRLDHAHAVYVIIESLQTLGLPAWAPALLLWLSRYDGMEAHLQEGSDPLLNVRQVLLSHVADKGLVCKGQGSVDFHALQQQIAADVTALDFVHQRCYWSSHPPKARLVFDPLKHTFLEFIQWGNPGEQLCIWRPEEGNPLSACASFEHLMEAVKP